ncbi:hypothetical protein BC830DRAFT_1117048, partial [Chytriomyces sp. MP71]
GLTGAISMNNIAMNGQTLVAGPFLQQLARQMNVNANQLALAATQIMNMGMLNTAVNMRGALTLIQRNCRLTMPQIVMLCQTLTTVPRVVQVTQVIRVVKIIVVMVRPPPPPPRVVIIIVQQPVIVRVTKIVQRITAVNTINVGGLISGCMSGMTVMPSIGGSSCTGFGCLGMSTGGCVGGSCGVDCVGGSCITRRADMTDSTNTNALNSLDAQMMLADVMEMLADNMDALANMTDASSWVQKDAVDMMNKTISGDAISTIAANVAGALMGAGVMTGPAVNGMANAALGKTDANMMLEPMTAESNATATADKTPADNMPTNNVADQKVRAAKMPAATTTSMTMPEKSMGMEENGATKSTGMAGMAMEGKMMTAPATAMSTEMSMESGMTGMNTKSGNTMVSSTMMGSVNVKSGCFKLAAPVFVLATALFF